MAVILTAIRLDHNKKVLYNPNFMILLHRKIDIMMDISIYLPFKTCKFSVKMYQILNCLPRPPFLLFFPTKV